METFTMPSKPQAAEPNSLPTKKMDVTKPTVEAPLSQWGNVNNKTYTEEFFQIRSDETYAMDMTIKEIEDYVAGQVGLRKLSDSKESYDLVMNELFEVLGVEEANMNEVKLDKVLKLIQLMNRKYDVSKRLRPNSRTRS